jgi:hypothetical protein
MISLTITSIEPLLEKIKQTDFHLAAEIELHALKEANKEAKQNRAGY